MSDVLSRYTYSRSMYVINEAYGGIDENNHCHWWMLKLEQKTFEFEIGHDEKTIVMNILMVWFRRPLFFQ